MKLINKCLRKDYMQFVFDMENGHEYPCAEFVYGYGNHRIVVSLRECKFEQNSGVNMVITTNEAITMVEELRKAYGLIAKKFEV